MPATTGGLTLVTVTRDDARMWRSVTGPDGAPQSVRAPSEKTRHHHVREAQHHHGHDTDRTTPVFYESISRALADATSILLFGHGRGKANEAARLTRYWQRAHPDLARRVVGTVETDVTALSEPQLLALAREWFQEHREFR